MCGRILFAPRGHESDSYLAGAGVEVARFESLAPGDGDQHSDVDVLVGFDRPAALAQLFGVQFVLEDAFVQPEIW